MLSLGDFIAEDSMARVIDKFIEISDFEKLEMGGWRYFFGVFFVQLLFWGFVYVQCLYIPKKPMNLFFG